MHKIIYNIVHVNTYKNIVIFILQLSQCCSLQAPYCIIEFMNTSFDAPSLQTHSNLTAGQATFVAQTYGSPVHVYSKTVLEMRARQALAFSAPFGLTVRYAMKANPHPSIISLFDTFGIHIDASSGFEAVSAMRAGVAPSRIMITSQQIPDDLVALVKRGVLYNATSLHQLEYYGQLFPDSCVSVRLNPGIGSGHSRKTNTGGPTSSFGIWHEQISQVKQIAATHRLTINKVHTHIGAGTDPKVWHEAARLTLDLAEQFPHATAINLGGGFKVARMSSEHATDLAEVSQLIAALLKDLADATGRKLHLEIEPGTYLVANAGSIVSRIIDIVSTGPGGYEFIKLDTGLTEIMRPSLYAAQHPIIVVNDQPLRSVPYVVVGHTCESGDLLTPEPGQPDVPATRLLQQATIGDVVLIEGTGAYCASMSAKGYNSFPIAQEIFLTADGRIALEL